MRTSFLSLALAAFVALPACQQRDTATGASMTPTNATTESVTTEASTTTAATATNAMAAPPADGTTAPPPASGPMTDADFMMKAANGGMMEVEAAKQAQVKSTDPMVKSVADMILKDHTKANTELMALAGQKNVKLPAAPMGDAKMTLDKVMATSGKEFDRTYLNEMNTAHQKDISMFEMEASSGKDAEVRAFATRTLPALKMHGAMIEKHMKMQ